MDFMILGPPEVSGSRSLSISLAPKLWGVLASLLVAEGKPVSVESLVDCLWGLDPPSMATATVRTYVSRINTLLAHDGVRICRKARGYQLPVDPETVDLHRFRSLRRQAESVAESGDLGHAVTLLRQADELWQGPALMGIAGEWAEARRLALGEERHEVVKLRIGIELDRGRQASILGELRELSESLPFDEEITRALMISLYRLGRQKDALQVGRDANERFAEAGMDPSPQLRDVYTRILRGDSQLSVTPAFRSSGQVGQPNTLPPDIQGFAGREKESDLLASGCGGNTPVVEVIAGLAGSGKTALGVHVAHRMTARYPDAQLFLPFPGEGPGAVAEALHRLLRMLEVPATRIPVDTSGRVRLWRAEMAHRRAIVVLDDAPGPDEVTPIIPATGDSLTVVTSRRHADWPGQRVLRLKPLEAADSVRLLRRLADPVIGQDSDKTAMVASLCAGLPLAIRVAAGRLRERELADLDGLISELTDAHKGQAWGTEAGLWIFSAFELTYRRLTPEAKRIFRLLGTSPCVDFSLETAAVLMGTGEEAAADAIRVLSEHYLLERASADRFRFHDLVRSYIVTRCAQEEPGYEHGRAIDRLINYYSSMLKFAAAASHEEPAHGKADRESAIRFPEADSAHSRIEGEWRNILLAARHSARHERHRQCADLIHSLSGFLETGGYWSDAAQAHELALQACRILGDPARTARAALDLSAAYRRLGDFDKARHHAGQALDVFISLNELRGQAAALDELGTINWNSGNARDALAHHQEAGDLYQEAADRSGMATAVMHAANAYGSLGRYEEEFRNLNHALTLFRDARNRRGEAACLNNLGAVLDERGLHRDSVAHYEKSAAIFRKIGGRQNLVLLDHNLGRVSQYKGHYDEAITIYRKALAAYCSIGDLRHQAMALSDIGSAFLDKECYSEALAHHRKSAELAESIGDKCQFTAAVCGTAEAYRGLGSYSIAAENYDKAHRLAAEIEAPYLAGKALYGIAETLFITQGVGAAKIYWRQAHDIFAQLGVQEAAMIELRLRGTNATTP